MKKKLFKIICIVVISLIVLLFSLSACSGIFANFFSGKSNNSFVKEKEEETPEQIDQRYLDYIKPADDELDYLFESDYRALPLVKLYYARDAKAYGELLGIDKKITVEDIKKILKTNDKISDEYKDFIIQYAEDFLRLYPESDFRVFYHNLKTLEIKVVSEEEMMKETVSLDSAACYLRKENQILLLDGLDFSRESDNYIILAHELTHCARSTVFKDEEGNERKTGYYEYYLMGTYAEEGIITNIVYEMQGLGKRADFYPLQSSFYRIIMDCTGYSGSDFMNHSVNYLIKMMDDYMGDTQYAYKIVALIDSISSWKYTPYQDVDYENYQELCDYITKMYMKKYLNADMDKQEAETVYSDFISNVTHYFDKMKTPYEITADNFRPAFENCLKELNIN